MRRRREDRSLPDLVAPRSPEGARVGVENLKGTRTSVQNELERTKTKLAEVESKLVLVPKVEKALESLSNQMFDELLGSIGEKLSYALRDVMAQDIQLKPEVDKRNFIAQVSFSILRDGKPEHLLRGQGGSVVNVLSVGMRMFALAALDPSIHRRTLFLDEPDAWLSPDLVPRLMRVIALAAKELGFQVVVISHHDLALLREGAQKVIEFVPQEDGTIVQKILVDEANFGPLPEPPPLAESLGLDFEEPS